MQLWTRLTALLWLMLAVESASSATQVPLAITEPSDCESLLTDNSRLRIGIAQIAVTVGDFEGNAAKILRFVLRAAEEKVELLVFPEMVVSAYPPRDLLERQDFVQANQHALDSIAAQVQSIPNAPKRIVIGSIVPNTKSTGKPLFNAAVVLSNGRVLLIQPKRLLPTYDVFDERRYFEPGERSELMPFSADKGWACTICEDSWAGDNAGHSLYERDPADDLKKVRLVVNLSASPFEHGKIEQRSRVVGGFARKAKAALVYVNQVGAHDDLLFDGSSTVLDSNGRLLWRLPSFEETLGVADLIFDGDKENLENQTLHATHDGITWNQSTELTRQAQIESDTHRTYLGLLTGVREYLRKTGFNKVVLGLSGGIDSSVVATLLADAIGPDNVIGVLMPSKYSSDASLNDAQELAKNLGIKTVIAPIQEPVDSVNDTLRNKLEAIGRESGLTPAVGEATEDNVQARMRGLYLMAFANKFGMLVVNTSNKTELAVGQCTIYGDMAGALDPLGDLFKTEVYELARHLNEVRGPRIPENVFVKPASAELAPGQTDEGKFGPFAVLDLVLRHYLEGGMSIDAITALGFDPEYVRKTISYVTANEFKRRQSTIIFKVSKKAYGSGRRIPVAAKAMK